MRLSRREFLAAALASPVASALGVPSNPHTSAEFLSDALRLELGFPVPHRLLHGESSVAASVRGQRGQTREPRRDREERPLALRPDGGPVRYLRNAFPDLRRHFVFEYYPWYGTNPWVHWNDAERRPPHDIAASAYPLLGPYDSRDTRVLEQHARWMAAAGIGAINISW